MRTNVCWPGERHPKMSGTGGLDSFYSISVHSKWVEPDPTCISQSWSVMYLLDATAPLILYVLSWIPNDNLTIYIQLQNYSQMNSKVSLHINMGASSQHTRLLSGKQYSDSNGTSWTSTIKQYMLNFKYHVYNKAIHAQL